jgi:hypothetical protein
MAKNDHFTLIFRKTIKHFTNTVVALTLHHFAFSAVFIKIDHFKNVFVITIFNGRCSFYFTEMIYTKIMGNSHGPWQKFTFFSIPSAAHCINNADKNILEDIFSKVFVLY